MWPSCRRPRRNDGKPRRSACSDPQQAGQAFVLSLPTIPEKQIPHAVAQSLQASRQSMALGSGACSWSISWGLICLSGIGFRLGVEVGVKLHFRRLLSEYELIVHHQVGRMTDAEPVDKIGTVLYKTDAVFDLHAVEFLFQAHTVRAGLRRDDQYVHNGIQLDSIGQ